MQRFPLRLCERHKLFLAPVRCTHSSRDLSSQLSALSSQLSAISLKHKIHSLRLITRHSLPITVFLLFSASLRENAFALSHYPSLIKHHCFAISREMLCYVPYLQLVTRNEKGPVYRCLAGSSFHPTEDLVDHLGGSDRGDIGVVKRWGDLHNIECTDR